MVRVFNNKIQIMDTHTFEHWQHSSRKRQGSRKSGILFQIEKVLEASDGNTLCYVFIFEDAVAHISVIDPKGILTIEK